MVFVYSSINEMDFKVKKSKSFNEPYETNDDSNINNYNAKVDGISLPIININDEFSEEYLRSYIPFDEGCNCKERSGSAGSRKPSLAVVIPKLPGQSHLGSSESINQSPQSSPGYDVDSPKMRLPDVHSTPGPHVLSRKESYKDQRKKYRSEKKRVARELLSTLKDPAVVVLADWLKVRGTLKGWTKLWCVLKPGVFLLYKSSKAKSSHWTGTVLLNTCELIERPSKKDGFCFKLFHPLEQSIWATKGPEGETIGAMVQPLPSSHLIFRAPSQAAGKCWMDALELAVRCSSILIRSMTSSKTDSSSSSSTMLTSRKWNDADYEKHFKDQDGSEGSSGTGSPIYTPHSVWKDREVAKFSSSAETTPVRTLKPEDLRRRSTPSSQTTSQSLGYTVPPKKTSFSEIRGPSPTPCYQKLAVVISIADRELQASQRRLSAYSPSDALPISKPSPVLIADDLDDTSHEDDGHRESGHFSGADAVSGSESDSEEGSGKYEDFPDYFEEEGDIPVESNYVFQQEGYIGDTGEQTEELAEENKSLIWFLLKQVRPGMDLSKVVLPTFILEPRSFLDKLSDYYYHADILSKAVQQDDPCTRMKEVVRWYFSGFYKKPKGLKKPYNPILGETFRCFWKHANGSRTFYVAEQVSHHPPVSALFVTNRQEGFSVSATVLAKSKFYGNSTSAILDGNARLTMLPRGEDYVMTMPYAHCKGILMGTLTMELGGKVSIQCEKTGYLAELEFKLKPFLSGMDASNLVCGKLKLGKETLANIEGRWDRKIILTDKRTEEEEVLWEVTKEVKERRLARFTVCFDQQGEWESEKLWNYVSLAIKNDDQVAATEEKTILEEAQRAAARERKVKCEEWIPKNFHLDPVLGAYIYQYSDLRPWDPRTDMYQLEYGYTICTKTRHRAPMIRTSSIISVEPKKCESGRVADHKARRRVVEETSSGELDSHAPFQVALKDRKRPSETSGLLSSLEDVKYGQESLATEVKELRRDFDNLQRRLSTANLRAWKEDRRLQDEGPGGGGLISNAWISVILAIVVYSLLQWLFSWIFWI